VDKPDQQRDFFVSYAQADRAWAEWLAWELEAAGYTTVLQAWDMPAGTAFLHAMDQAVQATQHVVLVLSPAYLRSAMAEAEWRPAFKADPSGEARRLLPVRVEACEPEGLLADRVYIDLVGADEATARARLREEVARALRGPGRPTTAPRFPRAPAAAVDRPRFPTALPRIWNVPYRRNPDFTGREELLGTLADQLAGVGAAAVTQVLQGAGGVGKTTLAVEYAYRHRAEFDTVWWVRAEQPATLLSDLTDLATALGLAEASQADQQLTVAAVRRWLADHDRWLLILDNAPDPEHKTGGRPPLARLVDLLPQVLHGQILVTSRHAGWEQHAELMELEVFTPAEAMAFLLARSGARDEQAAGQIAELLDYLPLALEQAGAYTREARIGLASYLARLRQFPALTLARGTPRDRDPADTVATTWRVSLDQVGAIPSATGLLELCAFLAPDDIPRTLLAQLSELEELPHQLTPLGSEPFALDDAVAGLRRFGLIKASEQVLVIHRVLQQVVRDSLDPGQQRQWAQAALRLVRIAFPAEDNNPALWPAYAQLLPHALAVTARAKLLDLDLEQVAWLSNEAGLYLWQRADYQQARTLHERALAIYKARLGPDHPDTAQSLNNLASVLHAQGDLQGARALHERALPVREARLGADHPGTAWSLNNLASVLHAQGDLQGARALHERALAIREARLGTDHPDTVRSRRNLAAVVAALDKRQ
jgi:hypothetical protein